VGETLYSSSYQPDPRSALDVLAFVLTPSRRSLRSMIPMSSRPWQSFSDPPRKRPWSAGSRSAAKRSRT